MRVGGWFYTLGRDEPLFEKNLKTAQRLGSMVHSTQIPTHHAGGHPVTNDEVVETYLNFCEIGEKQGVTLLRSPREHAVGKLPPCGRCRQAAETQGVKLNMTLDHSHVIFKNDNPPEQKIGDIRGVSIWQIDPRPFTKSDRPMDRRWMDLALPCAAVPNNPKNLDTAKDDGGPVAAFNIRSSNPNKYNIIRNGVKKH